MSLETSKFLGLKIDEIPKSSQRRYAHKLLKNSYIIDEILFKVYAYILNMFHTRALKYTVNQYYKRYLSHIDNHQHVSVLLTTIIRVSQRILIKCTINC